MAEVDPARCPLCGQPNRCAMEAARAAGTPPGACWCTQVDFSAELLARVPATATGRACICADCARAGPAADRPDAP
ncbi:cysteine-rich CWC family protein [Ramlibacter sp.]|uniref:cysteine-rich CWC family protein n=1 Tax=Ramlibacter sp. TaxID=1917967 RepID=UPI0035AD8532